MSIQTVADEGSGGAQTQERVIYLSMWSSKVAVKSSSRMVEHCRRLGGTRNSRKLPSAELSGE